MPTRSALPIVALGSALCALAIPVAAPAAASSTGTMTIDCTKSGDLMTQAVKINNAPVITGDVDKDFLTMAAMQQKGMEMLMQVEAACGKRRAVKTAATQRVHRTYAQWRLEQFRNQAQS